MLEHAELTRRRALLALFHGTWRGEETLAPSPWAEAGTATGHVTFTPDLGDILLVQHYQQERQGQPGLSLRGFFTVDPGQGCCITPSTPSAFRRSNRPGAAGRARR